jgi:hypothetical protein
MKRPTNPIPIALAVGGIAFVLCLLRLGWSPDAFFRGYLPACLFWIGIPVGSLALLMIHRLTGGAWGIFIRPVLAASAGVLPVNVLFFIPLIFGLARLYVWAEPGWPPAGVAGGKAVYLQPGFFLFREAIVFALWLGLAAALGLWRGVPKASSYPSPLPEGEGAQSAIGLIVYGLTVTVFAIDWIMSLEPRWSSANIGFLAAVEPMLAALAFATAALCVLVRDGRYPPALSASRLQDLGGLLLAFVLLWGYLAFQQYLTIWSENLPDKAIWYVRRNHGGWRGWSWTLAIVAGALPFFLLLSHNLKRDPRRLIWTAGLVLAGCLLNTYWTVMPSFYPTPDGLSFLDLLPFVGIGGLWLAAFLWMLPRCLARYGTEWRSHGR